jgi:hypothetical protein
VAGVTFSEREVKKLILALAGSKAAPDMESEGDQSAEHEADPKDEDKSEDAADSAGCPAWGVH